MVFAFVFFVICLFDFFFFFFFFQAEDGIRDGRVTGVQTCALPIYGTAAMMTANGFPASSVKFFLIAAIILELGCGLALLVGFKTKWASFGLDRKSVV